MSEGTKVKKSRREWVKDVTIIFLVVMLVLTLFSNSFMNYSLPEVSTQYITSGPITSTVRGTGTVTASDPYVIEAKNNQLGRKVASVPVRVGDTVSAGDVIMILEEGDSQELTDAQNALEAAQEVLDQMIRSYQQGIISGSIPADAVYSAESGTAGTFSSNLAMLAQKESEIEAAEDRIDSYELQLEALNAQLKALEQQRPDGYDAATAAATIATYNQMIADLQNETTEEFQTAHAALKTAQAKLKEAEENAEENADMDELKADVERALADLKDLRAGVPGQIADLQARIGYWQSFTGNGGDIGNLTKQINDLQSNIEAERTKIARLNDEANEIRQQFGYVIGLQTQLEAIAKQREEIEKLREKVEKLQENGAGLEITAPVSGTITSLSYRAGETINMSDLGAIQMEGRGSTMTINVTADQARLLQVGEYADIQNYWYYSDVRAQISAIRVDPSNPQNGRQVILTVEGSVSNGQTLSVLMGQRSSDYTLTVPNSAIREDSNGTFVLIVTYRSSPLGTRYVATRVDVEVLASDENRSAITGELNPYDYVITTASKPVAPGQLIRLANN